MSSAHLYTLKHPDNITEIDKETFNITFLTDPQVAVLIPKSTEQKKLELILHQKQHDLQVLTQSSTNTNASQHVESLYQQYIDKLHKYNEVKDATQSLLGKLAEINQCTVQEMYEKYELSKDD